MDQTMRQQFIDELCPRLRPLIGCVMDCECGSEVVEFFRRRSRTWLEASDIAYHLRQPYDQVVAALNQLTALGILERLTVLGSWTFYGLTQSAKILNALEQFWAWRDDWRTRMEQLKHELQLPATGKSSFTSL